MNIRDIIAKRIQELDVSQAHVARMAKIHETSLYRFLAGATMRSDSLERLLDVLDLEIVASELVPE